MSSLDWKSGQPNAKYWVKKRHFLRCHLYVKCIILPRQARDKHRESTQKESGVSLGHQYACESVGKWQEELSQRQRYRRGAASATRQGGYDWHRVAAAAAAGAAETAASESAYAAGVQRGGVPQQITGGDAAILNEDEDEIMALEQAVSSSDGSRRDSIGSQLMQSFKEILAEPVAAQLVRGDAPLSAGGPPVEVDEDLCRYSRLSF